MKNLIATSFFVILIFNSTSAIAQRDTTQTTPDLIKTYIEESTENSNNPELYDLIEELRNNPINLNTATINDLMKIPFLDYEGASLIVKHRKKHGKFAAVNELRGITKLSNATIAKIKPFVTVENIKLKKSLATTPFFVQIRSRYIYKLQENHGFLANKFGGSRLKSYQRMKANYHNFRTAFLAEKDAGEKSFTDHYTYFLEGRKLGIVNSFVVGNYLVEFGQGLVLWSPYAFSKGSDAINPLIKRSRNIVGYSSADENNYFRGGAISLKYNNFNLSLYYSSNDIDGNIDSSTNLITSLPQDGFHRTNSETLKKSKVKESVLGGRIDYGIEDLFNVGFLYFNDSFNKPFEQKSIYSFYGNTFNFYSFSYKIFLNKLMFSGESAYNGLSVSHIITLEFPVIRNFILLASARSYPRNFSTLHARGFGERSSTKNEVGFYTGIKWRTAIGIFNFYFDQFKFPFATSSIPLPSTGNEFLINYLVRPFKKTRITLRYKNENKEISETVGSENIILNKITNNIRFDILYYPIKTIRLRSRIEMVYIHKRIINTYENGVLAFQDIQFNVNNNLRIYGRIIFFQTDSFESRLYEFENDLTGILNNPALFGKGMRLYLMLRYRVGGLVISAKYSELYKPEETNLGSGNSEINGNVNNAVNFQIDYRF